VSQQFLLLLLASGIATDLSSGGSQGSRCKEKQSRLGSWLCCFGVSAQTGNKPVSRLVCLSSKQPRWNTPGSACAAARQSREAAVLAVPALPKPGERQHGRGLRTELAGLQQTEPGRGPAWRDFAPCGTRGARFMWPLQRGWAVPSGARRLWEGRAGRYLQPGRVWHSPGPRAPCSPPNPAPYPLPRLSAALRGCSSSGPSPDTPRLVFMPGGCLPSWAGGGELGLLG